VRLTIPSNKMPLIIMCGFPSSGKTTRAEQLVKYFSSIGCPVELINVESLKISRNSLYSNNIEEKKGRASFRSAMERSLNKKTVVIVDENNLIKGFRYELYSRAREMNTTHAVVYCDVSVETSQTWNQKKEESKQYSEKIFQDLIGRLEVPNEKKRWDNPLFVVKEGDDTPLEDISNALLHGKAAKPSFATATQKLEDKDLVSELTRITQDIMKAVLEAQQLVGPGDVIKVPHTTEKVTLSRRVALPELRRLTNQYLKMCTVRPPKNVDAIGKTFADFLNVNI